MVADGGMARISIWNVDGTLQTSVNLGVGYVSDFAVLPDGRYLVAGDGLGDPGANLALFDSTGNALARGLDNGDVLPRGAAPEFPWTNLRQTFVAVHHDTAWAVSTISDSLWIVPLNEGSLVARSRRLDIPGYAMPTKPATRPRTPRDLSEWAKTFHAAAPPVASDVLLAIPFVQGVLNYGDPGILVVRDPQGTWHALSGAPPIVAADGDRLIGILNPLEDEVELGVFAWRR